MRRTALLASFVLAWPLASHWLVPKLLAEGHRLGHALGKVNFGAEPRLAAATVLPAPLPEEAALPLDATQIEQATVGEPSGATAPPRRATRKNATNGTSPAPAASLPTPKHGVRVNQASILRLARLRAVPQSQPVAANARRPAGLALLGVSGLGVGMRDGDVLTHVAGAPVSDPGQVVNLVLQARARRAPSVTARFFRNDEPWLLVVDMPYPEAQEPSLRAQAPRNAQRAAR